MKAAFVVMGALIGLVIPGHGDVEAGADKNREEQRLVDIVEDAQAQIKEENKQGKIMEAAGKAAYGFATDGGRGLDQAKQEIINDAIDDALQISDEAKMRKALETLANAKRLGELVEEGKAVKDIQVIESPDQGIIYESDIKVENLEEKKPEVKKTEPTQSQGAKPSERESHSKVFREGGSGGGSSRSSIGGGVSKFPYRMER